MKETRASKAELRQFNDVVETLALPCADPTTDRLRNTSGLSVETSSLDNVSLASSGEHSVQSDDVTDGYLLPSEIARLVLGYLRAHGADQAYRAFLAESPDLEEYRRVTGFLNDGSSSSSSSGAQKRRRLAPSIATTIGGLSLTDMLEEYCALKVQKLETPDALSKRHFDTWRRFEELIKMQKSVAGQLKHFVTLDVKTKPLGAKSARIQGARSRVANEELRKRRAKEKLLNMGKASAAGTTSGLVAGVSTTAGVSGNVTNIVGPSHGIQVLTVSKSPVKGHVIALHPSHAGDGSHDQASTSLPQPTKVHLSSAASDQLPVEADVSQTSDSSLTNCTTLADVISKTIGSPDGAIASSTSADVFTQPSTTSPTSSRSPKRKMQTPRKGKPPVSLHQKYQKHHRSLKPPTTNQPPIARGTSLSSSSQAGPRPADHNDVVSAKEFEDWLSKVESSDFPNRIAQIVNQSLLGKEQQQQQHQPPPTKSTTSEKLEAVSKFNQMAPDPPAEREEPSPTTNGDDAAGNNVLDGMVDSNNAVAPETLDELISWMEMSEEFGSLFGLVSSNIIEATGVSTADTSLDQSGAVASQGVSLESAAVDPSDLATPSVVTTAQICSDTNTTDSRKTRERAFVHPSVAQTSSQHGVVCGTPSKRTVTGECYSSITFDFGSLLGSQGEESFVPKIEANKTKGADEGGASSGNSLPPVEDKKEENSKRKKSERVTRSKGAENALTAKTKSPANNPIERNLLGPDSVHAKLKGIDISKASSFLLKDEGKRGTKKNQRGSSSLTLAKSIENNDAIEETAKTTTTTTKADTSETTTTTAKTALTETTSTTASIMKTQNNATAELQGAAELHSDDVTTASLANRLAGADQLDNPPGLSLSRSSSKTGSGAKERPSSSIERLSDQHVKEINENMFDKIKGIDLNQASTFLLKISKSDKKKNKSRPKKSTGTETNVRDKAGEKPSATCQSPISVEKHDETEKIAQSANVADASSLENDSTHTTDEATAATNTSTAHDLSTSDNPKGDPLSLESRFAQLKNLDLASMTSKLHKKGKKPKGKSESVTGKGKKTSKPSSDGNSSLTVDAENRANKTNSAASPVENASPSMISTETASSSPPLPKETIANKSFDPTLPTPSAPQEPSASPSTTVDSPSSTSLDRSISERFAKLSGKTLDVDLAKKYNSMVKSKKKKRTNSTPSSPGVGKDSLNLSAVNASTSTPAPDATAAVLKDSETVPPIVVTKTTSPMVTSANSHSSSVTTGMPTPPSSAVPVATPENKGRVPITTTPTHAHSTPSLSSSTVHLLQPGVGFSAYSPIVADVGSPVPSPLVHPSVPSPLTHVSGPSPQPPPVSSVGVPEGGGASADEGDSGGEVGVMGEGLSRRAKLFKSPMKRHHQLAMDPARIEATTSSGLEVPAQPAIEDDVMSSKSKISDGSETTTTKKPTKMKSTVSVRGKNKLDDIYFPGSSLASSPQVPTSSAAPAPAISSSKLVASMTSRCATSGDGRSDHYLSLNGVSSQQLGSEMGDKDLVIYDSASRESGDKVGNNEAIDSVAEKEESEGINQGSIVNDNDALGGKTPTETLRVEDEGDGCGVSRRTSSVIDKTSNDHATADASSSKKTTTTTTKKRKRDSLNSSSDVLNEKAILKRLKKVKDFSKLRDKVDYALDTEHSIRDEANSSLTSK